MTHQIEAQNLLYKIGVKNGQIVPMLAIFDTILAVFYPLQASKHYKNIPIL